MCACACVSNLCARVLVVCFFVIFCPFVRGLCVCVLLLFPHVHLGGCVKSRMEWVKERKWRTGLDGGFLVMLSKAAASAFTTVSMDWHSPPDPVQVFSWMMLNMRELRNWMPSSPSCRDPNTRLR